MLSSDYRARHASDRALIVDCERFNRAPFYLHMGMHAESDAPGTARVTLRYDERLTQTYGGLHGGTILSLADAAISIAIATLLEGEEAIATTGLSLQFIAPAGKNDVVAHGEASKKGKRMAFGRCQIFADERLVAIGQGSWYVGDKSKIDLKGR